MLAEIERFVNWLHRRNPNARTWRDYSYDLKKFIAVVGNGHAGAAQVIAQATSSGHHYHLVPLSSFSL